ncbi:MAG: hypothetical protein JWO47_448 [Candidatus Saccharibacteria bacterium]|nr:hypothetical protein [Candidatus Saccharibacteria bacterium]
MTTDSELTPVQNADGTSNPQSANGDVNGSNSGSFQQSAGTDSLTQSHPISVVQTGQPIKQSSIHGGSLALMWVFIVVASLVLIMIASSVFKWVMKRPEPVEEKAEKAGKPAKAEKEEKTDKTDKAAPVTMPKVTVVRPQGKKKVPRSKRGKK